MLIGAATGAAAGAAGAAAGELFDVVYYDEKFETQEVVRGAGIGAATGFVAGGLGYGIRSLWRSIFGSRGSTISANASAKAPVPAQVTENRVVGKAAERQLAQQYPGGSQQASFETSLGRRYVDNLVDGVAMESKVGRTSLTKFCKCQVDKDVELMNNKVLGIDSVQWHFFPGKSGHGPTGPLKEYLRERGIEIILH